MGLGLRLWEDPVFVPEIAPDSEEARGDEEADVRRYSYMFQAGNDSVVQHEADALYKYVALNVLHFAHFRMGSGESVVALHQIV